MLDVMHGCMNGGMMMYDDLYVTWMVNE